MMATKFIRVRGRIIPIRDKSGNTARRVASTAGLATATAGSALGVTGLVKSVYHFSKAMHLAKMAQAEVLRHTSIGMKFVGSAKYDAYKAVARTQALKYVGSRKMFWAGVGAFALGATALLASGASAINRKKKK